MLLRGDMCLRSYPAGWLIMAVLLMAGALFAQTPTARITGTITDSSGAIVPGAKISVLGQATGLHADATSNHNGIYNLPFLNPGRYELSVEATGFRRYVRPTLVLETGQILSLDVRLEVGQVSNAVTVTAQTPLLQAETSSVNQVIENRTIVSMPLASRRVGTLVRLMGNVTLNNESAGEGIVNFALAGGRSRQQNWQMDGGNIHNNALQSGILTMNPSVEALEEFKVEVNAYPAEYGRSIGGFISMTTKSGTNQFHGAAYEYLRNDALDARSFFPASKAPRRYNVFGATLGGPVRKDRTHFFLSYEGTRRRDGNTRTYNVPTREEIGGDFSARSGSLVDPLSRRPVAGNIIPPDRLDPVGRKLAALYPAPNVPGAASGANNFRVNVATQNDADHYIARLDHVFRPTDRVTARFFYYRTDRLDPAVFPVAEADPSGLTAKANQPNITTNWFHGFGPSLFSETRFTFGSRRTASSGIGKKLVGREAGVTGVPDGGAPRINVTGFSSIAPSQNYRTVWPQHTFQIVQSISGFSGKHNVKFGGEWRRSRNPDAWAGTSTGTFSFNDVATGRGFGLAALLFGWVNTAGITIAASDSRSTYHALYFQDDWKLTSRLTLNLGLRWDMDTPRREAKNRQSGFDPRIINPVSGTPGIVTFAGENGVSKYAHNFDKNNIGPRFGFAWRPWGDRMVFRGGYGLVYGPIYDATVGQTLVLGYGDVRSFASPDNGLTPAFLLSSGMPAGTPEPHGPGFGAVRIGQAVRVSPAFFDRDHVNTYAHHINFNIQRRVIGNLLLEAGYLANLAHKITGRNTTANEIRPELRGTQQNQLLRPFPQFSSVTWTAPNWGNSSYHALNLKIDKRFSAGLNVLSTYTWSKFLDDVEAAEEAGGEGGGPQSYYARSLDKALSGNDIRHRYTASMVYELPVGNGRRLKIGNPFGNAIAGGWSLGLIAELRSGLSFGVSELSNRLNAFSSSQRPNVVGDPVLPGNRPRAEQVAKWFNTEAFQFPGNGVLGNASRAVGSGPGLATFDVSLLKDFRLTERRLLQLRGEFFNIFNRPNFELPNGSRGHAAFGTISDSKDGRMIQIGLRIIY